MVSDSSDGSNRGGQFTARLAAGIAIALVIASMFIGWGLLKSTEYGREADTNTGHYSHYTREKIAESCVAVAAPEKAKCVYEARDQEREYRYDQRDLVAQKRSALWAYIMAVAAVVGVALSAVGVWLIKTTFDETQTANDISRQAFHSGIRPWVDVEVLAVSMSSSKESFDVTVNFKVTNRGKSPALNVETRARIITNGAEKNGKSGEFSPSEKYTRITQNLLPNGCGEDVLHPTIPSEKIKMIETGHRGKKVGMPFFIPALQLEVSYIWGDPINHARTVKNFAIGTVADAHRLKTDRLASQISLGEIPVTQIYAFESGIAKIT